MRCEGRISSPAERRARRRHIIPPELERVLEDGNEDGVSTRLRVFRPAAMGEEEFHRIQSSLQTVEAAPQQTWDPLNNEERHSLALGILVAVVVFAVVYLTLF